MNEDDEEFVYMLGIGIILLILIIFVFGVGYVYMSEPLTPVTRSVVVGELNRYDVLQDESIIVYLGSYEYCTADGNTIAQVKELSGERVILTYQIGECGQEIQSVKTTNDH